MDGDLPVLLLPVRLETRWMPSVAGAIELRVRLFPDVLHVASERAGLEADEAMLAQAFVAGDDGAWDELVRLRGVGAATGAVFGVRAGVPVSDDTVDTAIRAHLLPSRFALVLESGVARRVAWGEPVPEVLQAGVADPQAEATRWQFDFEAAERVGMALRVPFATTAEAAQLTRIVALGIRAGEPAAQSAALAGQLARQFGSTGGALLGAGTPTNNTDDTLSGFDPRGRADTQRDALRGLDDTLPNDSDGARLAQALGLPEAPWRAWPGARARADSQVSAMHAALWPGTLGVWLRRLLAPALPATAHAFIRALFVDDVRGAGHWPTLRVGAQPYGLLAATSLVRWQAGDETLRAARLLHELRAHWQQQATGVPSLHHGQGDAATLRAILAVGPVSRRFALRRLRPPPASGSAVNTAASRWAALAPMFTRFGLTTKPPMAEGMHDPQAFWSDLPAVAPAGVDRTLALPTDFLQALSTPLDARAVRGHDAVGGAAHSLLYILARAGLLEQGMDLVQELFNVTVMHVTDHRVDPPKDFVERPWRLLTSPHARLENQSISQAMTRLPEPRQMVLANPPEWVNLLAPMRAQRAGLARLAGVPVGRLEQLLRQTLDVASHRLDAWAAALASRRLRAMRTARPQGVHIGAWGWAGAPPLSSTPGAPLASEGFELAPSLAHARTAAVLRSGFTNGGGASLAIDLGSRRVRDAIDTLKLARAGQGVGELLGRRLERWLVDRGLGALTPTLRLQSPLPDARIGINGLHLAELWQAQPPAGDLAKAAAMLVEWVDGLSDLMLAEAVHHTVNGRRERARAAIDAIERGEVLADELDVASGPTASGRIAWQLAVSLPPSGGWPGHARSVRAAALPRVEAWAAALLGDPAGLAWTVRGTDADGQERSVAVTPIDAALTALDVVVLARRAGALAAHASATAELARVDAVDETPALQRALLVARLLARLLDGLVPRGDAAAVSARAEVAVGLLRVNDPARLAAWAGEPLDAAGVDTRLATLPADAARRAEALTGLRAGVAPQAPLPAALPDLFSVLGAPSVAAWLHDLGRIQPQIGLIAALALACPGVFAERWSVREDDDGVRTLVAGAAPSETTAALLVLDRWQEAAPAPIAQAALALHADAPRARAPQALLLAVPPVLGVPWTLSALAEIVDETIDMLPARAMPPDAVAGQYLPGLYIADDLDGEGLGGLASSAVHRVAG